MILTSVGNLFAVSNLTFLYRKAVKILLVTFENHLRRSGRDSATVCWRKETFILRKFLFQFILRNKVLRMFLINFHVVTNAIKCWWIFSHFMHFVNTLYFILFFKTTRHYNYTFDNINFSSFPETISLIQKSLLIYNFAWYILELFENIPSNVSITLLRSNVM